VRTLEISVLAILLASASVLVGALMRVADNRSRVLSLPLMSRPFATFPLLVVLYILFLVLPLYGIRIKLPDAGVWGWRSTSPPTRSRSSVPASPRSRRPNIEAARSIGLHPLQVLGLVIVPQVFRMCCQPSVIKSCLSCLARPRPRSSGLAN